MSHCGHDHSSGIGGVYQSLDELDFMRGPWMSAMNGDYPAIQKYLDKGGEPNLVDSSGYSALHYAAKHGNFRICEALIRNGANVNLVTKSGKSTALHRAALSGYPSVVRLLLENRANPKMVDADGKTPLHKAAEGNNAEVCKLLVDTAPETQQVLDKKVKYPKDYVRCSDEQKEAYKILWWR